MVPASFGSKRVCLVLAPFTPSATPGLGVSLLKASLAASGIHADVYYAALDFFRYFAADLAAKDAMLEHALLSSYKDLGSVFFSEALWGAPNALVHAELDTIRDNAMVRWAMNGQDISRLIDRLHGYAERVSDFIEYCYRQRDWDGYEIVGFSSTFCQNIAALALARRIHERHPAVHIVFGGANCEGEMGQQILRSFPQVDAVIQGEADVAFPEYVGRFRRREDLDPVPGLLRRCGSDIVAGARPMPVSRMDDLPYPDFSDYFIQLPEWLASIRVALPIETSRGCWWGAVKHCVFCGLNPTTMTFRSKTPARALDEFIALRDRYDSRNFFAVDNIIDHRYFKTLLPRLEGEGLNIFYETKSNLSEEDVRRFARAGVRAIQPGIESLATPILRLMEKGVQGYQNVELLKWCAMHGVDPTWFLLYRFPNEPASAYGETIAAVPRLVHLPPPKSPNAVVIDRYSPYFSRRDHFGFRNVRALRTARTYYSGLSEEALFNISYHFESDLPQGNELPYEDALWQAVDTWQRRHKAGAYFYQFEGDQVTLLLDTRGGRLEAFLLGGTAHRLHRFLREAHTRARIAERMAAPNSSIDWLLFPVGDIVLHRVGAALHATAIDGPATIDQLDDFLARGVTDGILLEMDGRYLALALDCTQRDVASAFGLEEFVRAKETDRIAVEQPC